MTYILPTLRLARHYAPGQARSDGTPAPAAFTARPANQEKQAETFLSTELVEQYHYSGKNLQLADVQQTLQAKRRKLRPSHKIAAFSVGEAKRCCENDGYTIIIRYANDDPNDPAHVGIYGNFDDHREDIAEILATQVNHRICPAI